MTLSHTHSFLNNFEFNIISIYSINIYIHNQTITLTRNHKTKHLLYSQIFLSTEVNVSSITDKQKQNKSN
jgi:hypothetical protein